MTVFHLTIDDDESGLDGQTGYVYDDECTARISNPAAENGEPTSGALSWLNSARVTADPDEDAVHCVVSVADPRGGFCFTVRRMNDGTLIMHVPQPRDGMLHAPLEEMHPGTFRIGSIGAWADDEDGDEE